jgi:hypothetical protein
MDAILVVIEARRAGGDRGLGLRGAWRIALQPWEGSPLVRVSLRPAPGGHGSRFTRCTATPPTATGATKRDVGYRGQCGLDMLVMSLSAHDPKQK